MSRADDVRAAQAAELEIAEAEDELIRLKEGDDPEALAEHKHVLRELRRAYREERAANATTELSYINDDGEWVTIPRPVEGEVEVE